MQNLTFEQKVDKLLVEIQELKQICKAFPVKDSSETYTISEACALLSLSRTTFDRYVKEGKISVNKVLGRKYVSAAVVQSFLNDRAK